MRKIYILICAVLLFVLPRTVEAKLLPRFVKSAGGGAVSYTGLGISPRLRSDRKALNVYFSGLSKAQSVSYILMYQTEGRDEGVGGSLDLSGGDAANRELLFGTCSSGVCRYHTGITNMKFEVTTELLNSKKTLKRFRIKV